jgi:hypothetical protein
MRRFRAALEALDSLPMEKFDPAVLRQQWVLTLLTRRPLSCFVGRRRIDESSPHARKWWLICTNHSGTGL